MTQAFDQGAWEAWCLADFGKATATVRYHVSRLRAMQRQGFDADAYLATPAGGHREAQAILALVKKRTRPSIHVERNYRRVLNWMSAYAEHLQPASTWTRWPLPKEPPAMPKTVDADLQHLRTYTHRNPYVTLLRRAIADVALAGNFRRDEIGQLRVGHLHPETGQIMLPRAAKGGISGLVEVPWTLYWPDAPLIEYLAARIHVPGNDALWTMPATHGHGRPHTLGPAGVYQHLRAMGKELGIPLTFIRTRRRSLSDIDDRNVNLRVVQSKGRHNEIKSTVRYLRTMTSTRARTELEVRGVPGYEAESAQHAVQALPAGPGGTSLRRSVMVEPPGPHREQEHRLENRQDEGRHDHGHHPAGNADLAVDASRAGTSSGLFAGIPGRSTEGDGSPQRAGANAPHGNDEQQRPQHQGNNEQDEADGAGAEQRIPRRDHGSAIRRPVIKSGSPEGVSMVRSDPMASNTRPSNPVGAEHEPLSDGEGSEALSRATSFPSSASANNQETTSSMPTTQLIVKKGSVRAAPKPVFEIDPIPGANVVPGEPVSAGSPSAPPRGDGARETSNGRDTEPTRDRRGTFARTSRVAPIGARMGAVVPRHPATRKLSPAEVRSAVTRARGGT